jgi:hypothetical protein
MTVTVPPADEYMHSLGGEPTFNESMYFNVYDAETDIGVFVRLGNRPNEGHAEMTVAIYLADGTVAFMYGRPPQTTNERFAAGGLTFEVVEPFDALDVKYSGPVLLLPDASALLEPKSAFAEAPRTHCELQFRYSDVAPAWGGELDRADSLLSHFWTGHYEAHSHATGSLAVGGSSWPIDGFGLRDHSWGPRSWQSIRWYRWLTANFGEDGFVLSQIGGAEGPPRIGGAMLIAGVYQPALDVQLTTTWTGQPDVQDGIEILVRTAEREHEIHGRVRSVIPLRHRRRVGDSHETARIAEGLTEWTWGNRKGFGLSEYLDMIIDGRPAGVHPGRD